MKKFKSISAASSVNFTSKDSEQKTSGTFNKISKSLILLSFTSLFLVSANDISLSAPKKVVTQPSLQKLKNETDLQFVNRVRPANTKFISKIVKGPMPNSLIAFYGYDDPQDPNIGNNLISGYLYYPIKANSYKSIKFAHIPDDGGYPEITSVFFANADRDKDKELLVMVKYPQNHLDYSGEFFHTFIYDNPDLKKGTMKTFEDLSNEFVGCDCGFKDGRNEKAKYKSEADVKVKLKTLGY